MENSLDKEIDWTKVVKAIKPMETQASKEVVKPTKEVTPELAKKIVE